jgi:hypothetical protein
MIVLINLTEQLRYVLETVYSILDYFDKSH